MVFALALIASRPDGFTIFSIAIRAAAAITLIGSLTRCSESELVTLPGLSALDRVY